MSSPVDFARETDFVHFLCVENFKTAMYLYENQRAPDRISLFSRRNFLKDNLGNKTKQNKQIWETKLKRDSTAV